MIREITCIAYGILLAALCRFGLQVNLAILLLSRKHLRVQLELKALLLKRLLELLAKIGSVTIHQRKVIC